MGWRSGGWCKCIWTERSSRREGLGCASFFCFRCAGLAALATQADPRSKCAGLAGPLLGRATAPRRSVLPRLPPRRGGASPRGVVTCEVGRTTTYVRTETDDWYWSSPVSPPKSHQVAFRRPFRSQPRGAKLRQEDAGVLADQINGATWPQHEPKNRRARRISDLGLRGSRDACARPHEKQTEPGAF
jgi:hypothetical protein